MIIGKKGWAIGIKIINFSKKKGLGIGIFENNIIQGVLLSIPTKMRKSNEEYIVNNLSTWFVLQEARKYSVDILRKIIEHPEKVFFSTSAPRIK